MGLNVRAMSYAVKFVLNDHILYILIILLVENKNLAISELLAFQD